MYYPIFFSSSQRLKVDLRGNDCPTRLGKEIPKPPRSRAGGTGGREGGPKGQPPHPLPLFGQLISGGNFGVFKSSKKQTSFLRISALASKIVQIKQWDLLYIK